MTPRSQLASILEQAFEDGTAMLRFLDGRGIGRARAEIRFNGRLADECFDAAGYLLRHGFLDADMLWGLLDRSADLETPLVELAAMCGIPWDGAPPTVLFVPAVPLDVQVLPHVQIELRTVRESWNPRRVRDLPAARSRDLARELGQHPVSVLHFSGHGDAGALLLHSDQDTAEELSVNALNVALDLAARHHREIELIVLNGCATASIAEAIARPARPAIGVNGLLDDRAAARFTEVLHRDLARDVGAWRAQIEPAFSAARAAVQSHERADYRLYPCSVPTRGGASAQG